MNDHQVSSSTSTKQRFSLHTCVGPRFIPPSETPCRSGPILLGPFELIDFAFLSSNSISHECMSTIHQPLLRTGLTEFLQSCRPNQ
ncbi:hypothetical protein CICLE_v10006339mg [Citrus x clementina]|uniref:Uncharacterized protein n=1 Tax=Citrus clementina TaxID=85681 RepID=V4S8V5_CITCL|nr:hypothetical protein CICLE_v10006339mg [Citrus x clementina]